MLKIKRDKTQKIDYGNGAWVIIRPLTIGEWTEHAVLMYVDVNAGTEMLFSYGVVDFGGIVYEDDGEELVAGKDENKGVLLSRSISVEVAQQLKEDIRDLSHLDEEQKKTFDSALRSRQERMSRADAVIKKKVAESVGKTKKAS